MVLAVLSPDNSTNLFPLKEPISCVISIGLYHPKELFVYWVNAYSFQSCSLSLSRLGIIPLFYIAKVLNF